jgi:hypothetical protein
MKSAVLLSRFYHSSPILTPSSHSEICAMDVQLIQNKWRKRVGVEPTSDRKTCHPPVLKTGTITGPHALPCRGFYVSCEAIGCIGLVFHVEHFVLANLYGQLYTYSRK